MNTFIQIIKKSILLSILGFITLSTISMTPPGAGGGGQMQFSEEDLKMFEEINKTVQNYVNSLPTEAQLRAQGVPEEQIKKTDTQESFARQVEEYSKLSEEELLQKMEEAFNEVAAQQQAPPAAPSAPAPRPTAPTPAPEAAPAPKPAPAAKTQQQNAVALLDRLITSINNFLRKAQILVELPTKVTSWAKQGKLRNWPASLTWNTFKNQVEDFESRLNKLKDRDPKTNAYKYIDDLIKDEALFNNLTKVNEALIQAEPSIELSSFGVEKMTSKARQATRGAISTLLEATTILGIQNAIDKIFEKYEPTAKKIKEAEEISQKQALEKSRIQRTPSYPSVSSAPYREPQRPSYGSRERDNYYAPSFEGPRKPDTSSTIQKPEAKAAGGGKEGKKDEGKKEEKPKREEDKSATEFANEFNRGLYNFMDAVENDHLLNIETHMKDASPVDEELVESSIKKAIDGVKQAVRAAKRMKTKLTNLTDAQKKEYRQDIKSGYKEAKNYVDKMINQLNAIEKSGQSALVSTSKNQLYTDAKYYFYFGKKNDDALQKSLDAIAKKRTAGVATSTELKDEKDIQALKTNFTKPPNLTVLKNDLQELRKYVDEI